MARYLVEKIMTDFNRRQGEEWYLSLPAQIVIQQTYISVATDQVGLIGLYQPEQRRLAQRHARDALPGFLERLVEKARTTAVDQRSGDEKVIGAIFVTQNIGLWAEGFLCWQRD